MGLKSLIIKGILILTLVSSVAAIYTPQPVYSILFLILTFYGSALLLFSLGLNLFGFIYLIIYAGAIAVLLLFIVMMLDLKVDSVLVERRSSNTRGDFLLFISIVLCVLFEFSTFIFYNFSNLTSFNS
jgi:NADH:ubiquinone oxidoreductase subunit 6 (subunit J)